MRKHPHVMLFPAWPARDAPPHTWDVPAGARSEASGPGARHHAPHTAIAQAAQTLRTPRPLRREHGGLELLCAEKRSTLFAHPAVVGLFLGIFPPVGFTLLWATGQIPREGKIAISLLMAAALGLAWGALLR